MVAYIDVAHHFSHLYANIIAGPDPLATCVFSVYFHFYVHLWLHLLPVKRWHAVEASGQANLLLEDVEHRLVVISSQRALSKLECVGPLRLISIRFIHYLLSPSGMATKQAP